MPHNFLVDLGMGSSGGLETRLADVSALLTETLALSYSG